MFKALGLAVAIAAAAVSSVLAAVQPGARSQEPAARSTKALRNPSINWSQVGAVRYALEAGCLPSLRDGGSPYDTVRLQFDRKPDIAHANRISGDVTIQSDQRACVVMSMKGGAAALRAAAVRVLAGDGATPIRVLGPADHVGPGPVAARIEIYCLVVGSRPVEAWLSTYAAPREPALMIVLWRKTADRCQSQGRSSAA